MQDPVRWCGCARDTRLQGLDLGLRIPRYQGIHLGSFGYRSLPGFAAVDTPEQGRTECALWGCGENWVQKTRSVF